MTRPFDVPPRAKVAGNDLVTLEGILAVVLNALLLNAPVPDSLLQRGINVAIEKAIRTVHRFYASHRNGKSKLSLGVNVLTMFLCDVGVRGKGEGTIVLQLDPLFQWG